MLPAGKPDDQPKLWILYCLDCDDPEQAEVCPRCDLPRCQSCENRGSVATTPRPSLGASGCRSGRRGASSWPPQQPLELRVTTHGAQPRPAQLLSSEPQFRAELRSCGRGCEQNQQ